MEYTTIGQWAKGYVDALLTGNGITKGQLTELIVKIKLMIEEVEGDISMIEESESEETSQQMEVAASILNTPSKHTLKELKDILIEEVYNEIETGKEKQEDVQKKTLSDLSDDLPL